MRRVVLLFGLLAGCFLVSLAVAQETGWEGAGPCTPDSKIFDETLPVPILNTNDEGGPSSFVVSWEPVEGSFAGFYIYIFLDDPFEDPIGNTWDLCHLQRRALTESTATSYDFETLITDNFGSNIEGRIWVSVHTKAWSTGDADYNISRLEDSSWTSIFLDTTDPAFFNSGFAELPGSDDLVRGTSQNEIIYRGNVGRFNGSYPDSAGAACYDDLLTDKYTLVLDDLGGADGFTYAGGSEITLDSCTFEIPLGIPSGANEDRKYLIAHLRDFAHNESVPDTVFLEYFKPVTAQAYPNPLVLGNSRAVTIQVEGAINTDVPVRIFGPFGRVVKTLSYDSGDLSGEMASLTWDGTNGASQSVGTGVYLYVIETENGENITGKIAVVK
jgi:hypothetical protein